MFVAFITGENRNQIILFPECMDDYIDDNNITRVIDEYVEQLDMKELGFSRATPAEVGRPPYNDKDLAKLYIYGYLNRLRSSRKLELEAIRNIEVIWLLRKLRPDDKTISDFRKNNLKALKNLFRDFNKLCAEWGLFGKKTVAIDGSKFRASNSKRNNFNEKKLDRHINYIDEKIDTYLAELDNNDVVEASERRLSNEELKIRIKQLKERKGKYEGMKKTIENGSCKEISTVDPDARMMVSNNNGIDVSFNVQTTVDAENKLVADFKVTNQANDIGELDNMALRAKKLFDVEKLEVLADKGYYKAEDLKKIAAKGIDAYVPKQTYSNGTGDEDFYSDKFTYDGNKNVYICPNNQELFFSRVRKSEKEGIRGHEYKNVKACKNCEFMSRCTKSKTGRSIFRHKDQNFLDTFNLKFELNIKKYRERQMIVEHPYGTIKRCWGFGYFLLRGKAKTTCEMALTFLAYNMKRAINILGNAEILRRLRERTKMALE